LQFLSLCDRRFRTLLLGVGRLCEVFVEIGEDCGLAGDNLAAGEEHGDNGVARGRLQRVRASLRTGS